MSLRMRDGHPGLNASRRRHHDKWGTASLTTVPNAPVDTFTAHPVNGGEDKGYDTEARSRRSHYPPTGEGSGPDPGLFAEGFLSSGEGGTSWILFASLILRIFRFFRSASHVPSMMA